MNVKKIIINIKKELFSGYSAKFTRPRTKEEKKQAKNVFQNFFGRNLKKKIISTQ